MARKQLETIVLQPETRAAIAQYLMGVARNGYDVQTFDPTLKYQGTKRSLAQQAGYYPTCNFLTLKKLGYAIAEILQEQQEWDAIACFSRYRSLFSSSLFSIPFSHSHSIPYIQKIQFLPDDLFQDIDPADLVAPNGLRIPDHLNTWPAIRDYAAKLLIPKLLLAAICSLHNQQPWMDVDMDLNSTMHAMRTDPDKLHINAGYGGGYIKQHTDGYWNPQANVPLMVVFLGISNPQQEPTYFIPVEAIFRVPAPNHPSYQAWHTAIQDLIPAGKTAEQFLAWIIAEAIKPQFSFVMGVLGGDAKRGVYHTPLLEKDSDGGSYLFRAKSTFQGDNPQAEKVVAFTNRMIQFLTEHQFTDAYKEISLSPGEVYLALNGAGLQLNGSPHHNSPHYEDDGYAYFLKGAATIHGRHQLTAVNGRIDRTLARGNSLRSLQRTFYSPQSGAELLLAELKAVEAAQQEQDTVVYPQILDRERLDRAQFFPAQGSVNQLLNQGIRGNLLKR